MLRHRWLLLTACVVGLGGFVADKSLTGAQLGYIQMALCTVLVFSIVGAVAGRSLGRPRQAGVAVVLAGLHFWLLERLSAWFPLQNSVIGISGAALETLIMIFLFARVGQSIDPESPYGLTATELDRRRMLKERLDQTLELKKSV